VTSDAARLEALGDPEATLEFRGYTIIIARAIENWPLDAIRAAAAEPLPGRALMFAVTALLAGQDAGPMRCIDDYVELSHRMADTVGCAAFSGCEVTPFPDLLDELPARERRLFHTSVEALTSEIVRKIDSVESA